MKYLITSLTVLLFFNLCKSQSRSEDSVQLAQTIEWLEDKLTYHYYNVDDDEWWINRFTYNHGSKTITIKNIASPKPLAVTDKTYLELNFEINELNPYTISVEEREANAGRLVKGKTIRVGAYDDNAIRRTRNGRLSTRQSFIYFSIPEFFEDSVKSYTQSIADKLTLAIQLSTKLYPSENTKENMTTIKALMYGRFKSGDSYWVFRQPFPELFEVLELNAELELIGMRYLRMPDEDTFSELTKINPTSPPEIYTMNMDPENGLLFASGENTMLFQTKNQFTFNENGKEYVFIRDGSFDRSKAKYR